MSIKQRKQHNTSGSVTMIDKQIRSAIAELNTSDAKAALLKLEALKLQRLHAVRPKTYDRILASLG